MTDPAEHRALVERFLIVRWWDYWNLPTLMDGAPQWWLEHLAKGYR